MSPSSYIAPGGYFRGEILGAHLTPRGEMTGSIPGNSVLIYELPMDEFCREQAMNLGRIVAGSPDMGADHRLQTLPIEKGSFFCSRIQQYLLNISRKLIAIPNAKMIIFMSSEENSLQME